MDAPPDYRHRRRLHFRAGSPWLALALALVLAITAVHWFTRDGLRDNADPARPLSFRAVLYFTVVSLTTLGYGDITPVTDSARLLNAVLLTPARIVILFLFVGTVYELSQLRARYQEEYQMQRLRDRLRGHTIVCGYGAKGRAIVAELLAHGLHPEEIVVIDAAEEAVGDAARLGAVALRGDASGEALLRAAVVERAAHALVAPHRDDACALICLTIRSLAPAVWLVAAAREEENVKLLYRSGANVVVSPAASGGRLMAAAVRQRAVPRFLEDLLSFGHGVDVAERVVREGEAGRLVRDLPDLAGALVLGVARDERHYFFTECATLPLRPGDVVVYVLAGTPRGGSAAP